MHADVLIYWFNDSDYNIDFIAEMVDDFIFHLYFDYSLYFASRVFDKGGTICKGRK